MARDIDEEINDAMNEEIDFASLDEDYDLDNNNTRGSILVDTYAYIVHEIRKNPKFENMFEAVNAEKESIIEEKYKGFEEGNNQAVDTIVSKSYALNELELAFEKSTGREMNRVDYFTYEIDGVEYGKEDLAFVDVEQGEYDACLTKTIALRKSVKHLEKVLKRVELANKFTLRRNSAGSSEEWQISCLLVDKREKLMDGEAFLKKYEFINSLSDEELTQLRMVFAKAEIIGNALATIEENSKEQKSIEQNEGKGKIISDIFEKSIADGIISQEDYDELLKFIEETKQRVKSFEETEKDDSELGNTIRDFVYYIDNTVNRDKEFMKMINSFKEDKVKEEIEQTPLEFAPLKENEKTEEINAEKEKTNQEISKAAEDNLIVSFILESGKLKRIVGSIRDKEKDLCAEARIKINRELDQAYKDEGNATRYVETELPELSKLLEIEITEENGECHFGDLVITADDLELAKISEEEYEEKLDNLDEIVKAEKQVNKDIRAVRRREALGIDRSYPAAVDLYLMTSERDRIAEDREKVQREIKISELFAGFSEEELSRTSLFIKAAQLKEDSSKKTRDLTTKIVELEQPEGRQLLIEKALVECVKDGEISKEDNTELFNFILKIRDGVRSGKYQYVDSYERDESEDGLVVYDYIGLLDKNIAEMEKEKASKQSKDIDDDGDIDL